MKKYWLLPVLISLAACNTEVASTEPAEPRESPDQFVERLNSELAELGRENGAANWVRATYINHDTAILGAAASERYAAWHSKSVAESLQFADADMSEITARSLKQLKLGTSEPAPNDAGKRRELAATMTALSGMYGAGKYCPDDGRECMSLGELENILAESRDYDAQLDAWLGWREVSVPMRDKYARFVELSNEGANELGYDNLGELWRDGYDMSPADFEAETARLWQQVKPLYDALHCHVRAELAEEYGEQKVPLDGPIPAHLLGNMWAQEWGEIYDLLEPYPGVSDLDVDRALIEQEYTPVSMVESAEQFYVSLGFEKLPATFWERSMFVKPADRDVVCHASAWGLDGGNDLRIKMCIEPAYEDLRVIYHELGHNFYQRAYKDQPRLLQGGAHGGFHAVDDAGLSGGSWPDRIRRIQR